MIKKCVCWLQWDGNIQYEVLKWSWSLNVDAVTIIACSWPTLYVYSQTVTFHILDSVYFLRTAHSVSDLPAGLWLQESRFKNCVIFRCIHKTIVKSVYPNHCSWAQLHGVHQLPRGTFLWNLCVGEGGFVWVSDKQQIVYVKTFIHFNVLPLLFLIMRQTFLRHEPRQKK